jgi:hypothetical protein
MHEYNLQKYWGFKKFKIANRTRDLSACSKVPRPTTLSRTSKYFAYYFICMMLGNHCITLLTEQYILYVSFLVMTILSQVHLKPICWHLMFTKRSQQAITNNKLCGLTPRSNYTDRATAACRRRGCCVSTTDPYGRSLGFLDRSRYLFFQVAPQLHSRGWVGPVPDLLLLRKSGSSGNRTRTSGSVARNYGH